MASAFIAGAGKVIGGIVGLFTGGDYPQDFDILEKSVFLQWTVDKASSTGIPVLFCWFGSIVKVLPDGSFFAIRFVQQNCAIDQLEVEADEQKKGTIWGVRCRGNLKVTTKNRSEVESDCSFALLEGPGFVESLIDRGKDIFGFDGTEVIPQPSGVTPTRGVNDPTDFGTVSQAGLGIPSGAGIALAAVGLLLVFGLTKGK